MGNFFENLVADATECNSLYGAEREACFIRKGYRQTETGDWTRSTGLQLDPEKVLTTAATLVPAVGGAISTIGAIKEEATKPLSKPATGPAPAIPAPTGGGPILAGIDPATVFLLVGALVFIMFARR